jgi:hypothetical protein
MFVAVFFLAQPMAQPAQPIYHYARAKKKTNRIFEFHTMFFFHGKQLGNRLRRLRQID